MGDGQMCRQTGGHMLPWFWNQFLWRSDIIGTSLGLDTSPVFYVPLFIVSRIFKVLWIGLFFLYPRVFCLKKTMREGERPGQKCWPGIIASPAEETGLLTSCTGSLLITDRGDQVP